MRRDRRPLLRPARRHRPVPPRARARRLRRGLRGDDAGRPPATTSSCHALDALRNLDHRGATGAEADTGDGAGILIQVPDAFLRAVVDVRPARRPAPTPSAWRSCPPTTPRAATAEAASRSIAAERGPARSSAGATCPSTPDLVGAHRPRRACRRSGSCSSRDPGERPDRHRARPASPSACASAPSTRPTSTSRRCRPAPSSTRACSRPPQLEPFFPDLVRRARSSPRSRSCTPASRPTPSRRGRWPTRTATSPTTARSTPSRATATGCAPARRCSPATCSPATSSRLFPICTPGASRLGHASTRCSSCCTSAAARCRTPC